VYIVGGTLFFFCFFFFGSQKRKQQTKQIKASKKISKHAMRAYIYHPGCGQRTRKVLAFWRERSEGREELIDRSWREK